MDLKIKNLVSILAVAFIIGGGLMSIASFLKESYVSLIISGFVAFIGLILLSMVFGEK